LSKDLRKGGSSDGKFKKKFKKRTGERRVHNDVSKIISLRGNPVSGRKPRDLAAGRSYFRSAGGGTLHELRSKKRDEGPAVARKEGGGGVNQESGPPGQGSPLLARTSWILIEGQRTQQTPGREGKRLLYDREREAHETPRRERGNPGSEQTPEIYFCWGKGRGERIMCKRVEHLLRRLRKEDL